MIAADRRGAVLLEALVALVVLGVVGSAAVGTASESMRAVAHAHETEERVHDAARLMTAVSLWPRADLDRHLGTTVQGPWHLRIDRPTAVRYEASLTEATTGVVLLRTILVRPDTTL